MSAPQCLFIFYNSFSLQLKRKRRRVLLKHWVNWTEVCDAIGVLPWWSIWSVYNPVKRLNVHLSLLVKLLFRLRWSVCVTKINLGLMMTADVHLTSSRGPISGGLMITLELTGMSFSWPWSQLFGSSSHSSLPPLIGMGGGLVCESVGKAHMLSAHFDGKLSRDPVDLPSTCHLFPSLTTFAFRSWEVKWLLLDLASYGGTDPLGMFRLFLKRTAEVLAPRFVVVFWRLICLGSFPVCWRVANVTQIPKVQLPPQHPIIDQFP